MAFLAGAYTVQTGETSDAGANLRTIGQVMDGIKIEWRVNGQLIRGDNRGLTVQDAIFQGQDMFIDMHLMESELLRARLAYWPYKKSGSGDTVEGVYGTQDVVGLLDVGGDFTQYMVLTSTAGTSSVIKPASIILPRVIIAEDIPIRIKIAPELKSIALRFRAYPDASGVFFTMTT